MVTPCPVLLGDAPLPASDIEGIIRLVLGHRRLTRSLADAIDAYSWRSALCQTWSATQLLDGYPLADTGASYMPVECGSAAVGAARYALTSSGIDAVGAWLDRGRPDDPLGGTVGGQRAVLLVLAGSGTGPVHERPLRSTKERRRRLDAIFPSHPSVASVLCAANQGGLERERIQDLLAELLRQGAGCALGLDDVPMTAQRVGQLVRHAMSTGMIAELPPKPVPAASEPIAILQAPGWTAIRRSLRRGGWVDGDTAEWGWRLATRSSVRRSLPTDASTDAALSERVALERAQAIVGSALLHHPRAVWATASLLSLPVTLHPQGSPRAGHPTSADLLDAVGQPAGPVVGYRTPDAALWLDPGPHPDVLIEYEGDGSRLRIVEHLEAALWLSSRAGRPLTLVIGTTTRSETGVRRAIDTYVSTRQPWVHRADWPSANVRVRLARATALRHTCPLHGDVNDEWLIRA